MKKGYRLLTQKQIAEILCSYKRTKSIRITADELGWTLQRVRYHVKKAGIPLTRYKPTACYRNYDLVVSLVEAGESLSEIARRVGTKDQEVKSFLERYGISYTPYDQSGKNNPNWRGGRRIDKDGYVLIHSPDHPHCDRHGYMREHRLVMEQALGRYLLPTEVVHHQDDDHQNNAPENLRLYGSNSEHLASTLAGQVPNWTEDGKRRIREGIARSVETRRKSSRSQ